MQHSLQVVQCWDDGVTTDGPLIEILQRYGAKATFNLNIGLHQKFRHAGWTYHNTQVQRFGISELQDVYDGFCIANHSFSHPHLEHLRSSDLFYEIHEGRDRLQQLFGQPIEGFAYPFGSHTSQLRQQVRQAGHIYARTTQMTSQPFPPEDPMAFHPTCHFLDPDFHQCYEQAKASGVFYFWGHSYEMTTSSMWEDFERKIRMISEDAASSWKDVVDLFALPNSSHVQSSCP